MNGLPQPAPTAAPTWVRWQIVVLLMGYSFMQHFNRVSMAVAGDEKIMKEFDISPASMGLVYSAFLFTYTICMTPGGWLSDRRGPWLALTLMGLGSGLFCALTSLPGYALVAVGMVLPLLIVIRALMGFFSAPIYPSCGHAVSLWMPFWQRGLANGLVTGAAFLGIACSYFVFAHLMDRFGWPTAFVISGSVTMLLGLLWTLYATDRPGQHRGVNVEEQKWIRGDEPGHASEASARRSALGQLLRNRSLVLLTISYAAVGYFEYLFAYWMHYYFEEVKHLGKETSQYYASIPPLALIVCVPLGGWLSDRLVRSYGYRWGRALVPAVGMIASAVLLYLGALAEEPVIMVTWLTLSLGAIGACEGPFWATAIELGGRHGGTAGGVFNTGGNVGGFLAPYVTPVVGLYCGWFWALSLGSLVCLVGVVLWLWIDPNERVEE